MIRSLAVATVHVQTDWLALGTFVILVLGGVSGIAKWVISRIDRWSANLSNRFDKQDRKLLDIQEHLGQQDIKIARIEGRIGNPGRRLAAENTEAIDC